MKRIVLVALAAATFSVLAASATAPEAEAAGSLLRLGCPKEPAAREYERWGDRRLYKPFTNGGFEQGATGWRLTGGARVVPGNEPYGLMGGGGYSLELPSGASATASAECVRLLESWARFMVVETGSPSGVLKVELEYRGLLGRWGKIRLGSIAGTGEWEPSPEYPFVLSHLVGSILSLNVTTTDVKLRFIASGRGAEFRLDAAAVDPWLESW